MKCLLFIISIIFSTQRSFGQDWVYVGSDVEGGKWYIKSECVTKSDYMNSGSIKIWTKKDLKKTTVKKNGKVFAYTNAKELQLIYADCANQRIKLVSSTVYNSQGKPVDSWTNGPYEQEWIDVVPDSMGDSLLDKICELFN